MKKRFLAMALCLAMTLSLFPTGVFANPENEPAAPHSEAVAEIVQEQQTEAPPEAAGKTEESTTEAPAVPVMAEAEIAAEAEKAAAEPTTEAEKAGGEALAEPEKAESEASNEPAKADSEALAEPEKAESEASGGPAKVDGEPVEPEAETAKEPAEENSGSKWDALKNSIANLFGGAVEPASITPQLTVDTYEFYVDGAIQENWTQRVAEGDELKIPGTPKKDGYVFEGWFHGEAEVKGGKIEEVSGTTVRVDAKFQAASYVRFVGTDGTTVVHTVQGTKGDAVSETDISTAAEMVRLTLGSEESVQGWSDTNGGDPLDSNSIKFTEGTRTLFPVVKTGYWVTFDSDGGSYIAPQFSNAGETMQLSQSQFVPTRAGYEFAGWYLNGELVTSVSGKATVKASWKAKDDVKYTVIYWQENADDAEYSFKESETKTGTAGTKATPSKKSYDGFTPNTDIESKTIAGDGSTILNVYYKRNVYEVKFYNNRGTTEYADLRIKAKYGANISKKWPTKDGSSTWKTSPNGSTAQGNIDTMPLNGANFYGPKTGKRTETASYYVEVLPGETPVKNKNGIGYKLDHKDTTPGWWLHVTEEDQYPITGFDFVKGISTQIGEYYDDAEFYYNRKEYKIKFVNGDTTVETKTFKYQDSIESANYTPNRPNNVPEKFVFAGWYEDEPRAGEKFEFAGKTMPANNITLYAKWAAPLITVTIPKKDGSTQTITVPYGSKLEDSAEWKTLAEELHPDAWMNGDKIFNLNTELYENITLTPYYKNEAISCTITYDENGTTWPDTTKYAKGGKATILNPTHSEGLKFQCWKLDENTTLLPGQSITVTGDVTLTAVYGEPLEHKLTLTYHNGNNTKVFENLPANSEQTAANPATLGTGFETPKGKKFAGWATTEKGEAKYAAGAKFYITIEGRNDLYAIWVELPNISDENVATIDSPKDIPYDGKAHQWEPTVTKADTQEPLKKDTDYTVSYDKTDFTNVTGKITVTITGIGNYTGSVERTYQITKRSVTLTSETASKPYDGTPLTRPNVKVEGDGFVEGEVSEIKATGTVTTVDEGEVANKITFTPGEKFQIGNYAIEMAEGKLSITGQSIVPDPNNPESYKGITINDPTDALYDGKEHKWAPEVKDKDGNALTENTDYTVAYNITQKATPDYRDYTDVCTIEVTITGKGNYTGSVTKTYRITPRKVTLKSETASKPYDGTPLTKPDVKVEGDGFVAGEAYKILAHGTVTEVKDSPVVNEISYKVTENYKGDNYIVTYERGKLSITGQSIVPDPDNPESYRGITISDPKDSTYDGKEHKWAPEVKDKEGKALTENTDYTVSYDKTDFTNVTGKITVTITGIGNYTGKVEKSYQILPATLTVTTNSAEKTHDGNRLTADGTITGFVNGETATFMITGSQTDVGSSTNTYKIEWNGTAKQSNYTVVENLGTLKVNERSGGGGGSHNPKPNPEDEPTPAPVIVPPAPAPTPAPARRITPAATATPTPAPTAKPTETKQPEPEPEVIEDEETPLAPMPTGAWALVNLILMLLTVLASLLLLIGYLGKKKHTERDEYGNKRIDYTRNKKGFWRVASLIPAIAAVIAFVLTENMKLPMIMVDRWTLLMAVIAVLQLIVAVMSKKQKESQDDEDEANA